MLPLMVQRFQFQPVPEPEPQLQALLTLRPRNGLRVRAEPRG
jgi:cytochrome P450